MKPMSYRSAKLSLSAALLASALVAAIDRPGSAAAATAQTPDAAFIGAAEYETFLQDKFDISLAEDYTKGDFILALASSLHLKPAGDGAAFRDLAADSPYAQAAQALREQGVLTSDALSASAPLHSVTAVQIALKAAGLKELAYTYPQAKVDAALSKLHIKEAAVGFQGAQELAAAVDSGLLAPSFYSEVRPGAVASRDFAEWLIGQTLAFKGQYKHYLGYVGDPDIYAKLTDAYRESDIIQSPELQKIVDTALERNLVTGYNLKDSRYEPNFVESLTLVYGHSDLTHALQLIGLLRSEGIDAKVQFEPKTSAFIYLKEWGDPGVSDLYEVKPIANGNYIEYAKEYDIAFEFGNASDKMRFNAIIQAYAKKNEDNQTGLIAESWWQPLYYSRTELPDYKLITNNKIEIGHVYAQSFSLKEQSASVVSGFESVDPAVQVEHYDFWTDVPFYNYLNGESK